MQGLERFSLVGRTAVVTGGSRGLGRAMATALGRAGASLMLIGRDEMSLVETVQTLEAEGITASFHVGDVGTAESASATCEAVLARLPVVDILVNNVGGRRLDVATEDLSLLAWRQLLDLNLTSALVCAQRFGAGMLERRRGSMINITSIAGPTVIRGIHGRHYETAKAALTALTKSLAADWAPRGVRVNAIAPGVFETEPNRRWFREKPEFRAGFLDHIPMGRLGHPDELGPAAVFLASDASSYITGTTLVVDGGYTLW